MTCLLLLGGPVGVGKTTVMKTLKTRVPKIGLVDADEVWQVSDDIEPDTHRSFAHDNLNAVIAGYAKAGVETCVVNWVFARAELFQPVIDQVGGLFDEVIQLYLVAEPDVLANRIHQRMQQQGRSDEADKLIDYSLSRLALIKDLPYGKIDTTFLSTDEVAEKLIERLPCAGKLNHLG